MSQRAYLDYNATVPVRPAVVDVITDQLMRVGNPSSVHREGRDARGIVETARRQVAGLVGADAKNVTFTGTATEAAETVLSQGLTRNGVQAGAFLYVSAVEHPAVLGGGRFDTDCRVILPVDGDGSLDLAALEQALCSHDPATGMPVVAVMLANNETGIIQPIGEIAALVHAHEGLLVVDAVQAAGKIAIDITALGADILLLSSHKLGGPQGVGAIVRASDHITFAPLIRGGGQERSLRGGTEHVALIAGFGAACAEAMENLSDQERIAALRDKLEEALSAMVPGVVVFSQKGPRLGNTCCFALDGLTAETAMIAFDLKGVALSSGSACSSGKVKASHVLAAMGVSASLAKGALRVSLGWGTREEDVAIFLRAWADIAKSVRQKVVS